jgi:hypothetical protein
VAGRRAGELIVADATGTVHVLDAIGADHRAR